MIDPETGVTVAQVDQTAWAIRAFIAQPRTIAEIAEKFNLHPQTVRRKLWDLQDQGMADCHRGGPRTKVWLAARNVQRSEDRDKVLTRNGAAQISDLAQGFDERSTATSNFIAGFLSYLWRRAYYGQLDQSNPINVARQGHLTPMLDVKPVVIDVLTRLEDQVAVLKQLLNQEELWKDGFEPVDIMGDVNRMIVEQTAEWFDLFAHNFLEARRG